MEEEHGMGKRPVFGVEDSELDRIQKEMLGYNNSIIPAYFPRVIVEKVDGKNLLVLWVPTGMARPYKAPEHVTSKKEKKYCYYIRYASSSVKAVPEQERDLIDMTNKVPFDERPNYEAGVEDISSMLLTKHLKKTGSKLAEQVEKRGVKDVLRDLRLLDGPPEQSYIKNVALMMFCDHPDNFSLYAGGYC